MNPKEEVNEKLRALKVRRGQVKGLCTRTLKYLTALDETSAPAVEVINARQANFVKCLDEFNTIQGEIERLSGEGEDDVRDGIEQAYYEVLDAFASLHRRLGPLPSPIASSHSEFGASSSSGHSSVARVQLPKIELPSFAGDYESWITFKNLFVAPIHQDEALSGIQKFHYLRSSLKGAAAEIISTLDITETSYSEAWTLLNERFGNKRVKVQRHAKALLELPAVRSEDHVGLRRLIDGYQRHQRALRSMAADTKDVLKVQLLSRQTRSGREQRVGDESQAE